MRILVRSARIAVFLFAGVIHGANIDVLVGRSEPADKYEWKYRIAFRNLPKDERALQVRLAVPAAASFATIETGRDNFRGVKSEGRFYVWEFQRSDDDLKKAPEGPFTVELVLSGLRTEVISGSVEFEGKVGSADPIRKPVDGPEAAFDPGFFRLAFGGGASFGGDDFAEFEVQGDNIFTRNDSRLRASALFGGLFKLKDIDKNKNRALDLLTSFEFSDGTSRVLDGFVFGFAYTHHKYLSFVAGYSLRRQSELSPGFLLEAKKINPGLDLNDPKLRGIDGMSLLRPGGNQRFFPGNPIIDSFNSSFHMGVVVPIKFSSIFAAGRRGP
jgi:hypothetical protein